jgi:DNA helicase-2/ATP-dependent DNA helicase PcrA
MTDFDLEYKKLNEQQREAVDTVQGPVLVVAGPGSGKTQLLSMRVANILRTTDAQASNILCLTFTDSAAMELKERLLRLVGTDSHKVAIHTFHSFGTEIIGSYPEYFYNGATFAPTDELAQIDILQSIFEILPYDDPLASKMNGKFVRIRPVLGVIDNLKKSGLGPDELDKIVAENRECIKILEPKLNDVFSGRVSKATVPLLEQYAADVDRSRATITFEPFRSLSSIFLESLEAALASAVEDNSTKPITAWKDDWLKKDADNLFVFADEKVCETFSSITNVYRAYQIEMHKRQLFDFSDMVLEVVRELKENDELRFNIQERYQYLLADEFQDTNNAQMQLLNLIADNPVHEGRPDIMAVGDDDQGVYKFQGAELSNMLGFAEKWRDTKIITLVQNYRSGQLILDKSRAVITQAEQRLETSYDYVIKDLISNSKVPGIVAGRQFDTDEHEYQWVAGEVKRLIGKGHEANKIAVLGRNHKHLLRILPHLQSLKIPVAYDRQADVLTEPHIIQLVQMARLVHLLAIGEHGQADALLSEVMSYPFWGLNHLDLWRLSIEAFNMPRPNRWMQAMVESKDKRFTEITDFLLSLAQQAQNEPMEYLLDKLTGSVGTKFADTEEDDSDGNESRSVADSEGFTCPYREYYFPTSETVTNSAQQLAYLSSLRVLRTRLRDYRHMEQLRLRDFLIFIELFERNELSLIDSSPYVGADNAVNLMTAHKSKGQEFTTVFILNCQEDVWAKSRSFGSIKLPKNMPISPPGDKLDDQLRLFFVAMTRAKEALYLTGHRYDEKGKETQLATFLRTDDAGIEFEQIESDDLGQAVVALETSWQSYHPLPKTEDEKALLKPLLDKYALSVTHLSNFLDVTNDGPRNFLLHNMLRFPQAESASSAMGSAVHKAIQLSYIAVKQNKKLSKAEVLDVYEKQLMSHRLSETDHARFLKKGRDTLSAYLDEKYHAFRASDEIEQDFKSENVVIGEARLTGKIDKMELVDDNSMKVIDFKTGSGFDKWKQPDSFKAVKSWKYRNQLIFYKLLVENSRRWSKYSVPVGAIDFIEPVDGKIITLDYDIRESDVERQTLIINAVWESIMSLNFPDTSNYEQSLAGITQFEDDLIAGSAQLHTQTKQLAQAL